MTPEEKQELQGFIAETVLSVVKGMLPAPASTIPPPPAAPGPESIPPVLAAPVVVPAPVVKAPYVPPAITFEGNMGELVKQVGVIAILIEQNYQMNGNMIMMNQVKARFEELWTILQKWGVKREHCTG